MAQLAQSATQRRYRGRHPPQYIAPAARRQLMMFHFPPKQYTFAIIRPITTFGSRHRRELSIACPISYEQSSLPLSSDTKYSRPSIRPHNHLVPANHRRSYHLAARGETSTPAAHPRASHSAKSLSRPPKTNDFFRHCRRREERKVPVMKTSTLSCPPANPRTGTRSHTGRNRRGHPPSPPSRPI